MDIFSVLKLILGLSFFLFGMNVMSANLEKMSGGKLEQLLQRVTSKPLASLALGIVITIAVQSSSAVTVMLVGLVNSGIMTFSQTIYVIFGAKIGTTLTAWILSLSGIESDNMMLQMLKPENFSPILALIGILLLMICKNDRRKSVGNILVGFTVLMYGMEFMKIAVSPLANMPEFTQLLVKFRHPLVGLLVGTLFTALIQSSAASISILQALSFTGGITYWMAIPIIMGQNIGTCATSMISSIGTNTNAKRVAVMHLSINVIGTVICLSLYTGLDAIFHFSFSQTAVRPVTIALIHTVFNLLLTAILMPFSRLVVRLVQWMVPAKDTLAPTAGETSYAPDLRLLRAPSVALRECDSCTVRMAEIAEESLLPALELFHHYDDEKAEVILQKEDILDKFEDQLDTYLVYLSAQALSDSDSRRVARMQHAIGDFERLGDHAVNLQRAAHEMHIKAVSFSEPAKKELKVLTDAVVRILHLTVLCYTQNSPEQAHLVEPLEQVIDGLTKQIKENHFRRLADKTCSIEMGFILSDLLGNFERISDHCSNIAVAVIEGKSDGFDAHNYLSDFKENSEDYRRLFEEYSAEYQIKTAK